MIHLTIKVHPGAREERVTLLPGGQLDVRVHAPALNGRANTAVLAAVAAATGLRPRQVRLLRGQRSRQKLIEVDLSDRAELSRRLSDAPAR